MKKSVTVTSILSLLIFASCKKNSLETTYVPSYLKQMVPYTNGQTIKFIDTYGGILETTVSATEGFVEKSNCAGCDPYARVEYINYDFKVGIYSFIQMSIDVRPNIFLGIFSPLDNYQVGGGFDFITQDGVQQPSCSAPRQTCLTSVILNGQTFTNVLEIISGATASNELTHAYYTVDKGLVGFKYGSGYTFSLL